MTPDEAHAALDALLEHNAALERENERLRKLVMDAAHGFALRGYESEGQLLREALERVGDLAAHGAMQGNEESPLDLLLEAGRIAREALSEGKP